MYVSCKQNWKNIIVEKGNKKKVDLVLNHQWRPYCTRPGPDQRWNTSTEFSPHGYLLSPTQQRDGTGRVHAARRRGFRPGARLRGFRPASTLPSETAVSAQFTPPKAGGFSCSVIPLRYGFRSVSFPFSATSSIAQPETSAEVNLISAVRPLDSSRSTF
jgi:hypothetical protein